MASGILEGQLSGVGASEAVTLGPKTPFNLSLSGVDGTYVIERSFDEGATWMVVGTATKDYEGVGYEPEAKTLYHIKCTSYTSGPMTFRIGTRMS